MAIKDEWILPLDEPKPDLQKLLAKWQKILHLQDWDVKIRYGKSFELRAHEQGNVSWTAAKKSAMINILDPDDYDPAIAWPQDVEKTIVHELVHLHFAAIDKFDGIEEVVMEQGVELLSKALIELSRCSSPKSEAL